MAGSALIRQIVFPPWPHAGIPSASSLSPPQGYQLKELEVRAGERQRDWARSPTRLMILVRDSSSPGEHAGTALNLGLTRLAVRHPDHLQVAQLTRSDPRLSLRNRRILNTNGQEVALGFVGGAPALQTCLVPGGRGGITAHALGPISGPPPRDALDRLLRLLGLRIHRSYGCTLLSLLDTSGRAEHNRLLEVWSALEMRTFHAVRTSHPDLISTTGVARPEGFGHRDTSPAWSGVERQRVVLFDKDEARRLNALEGPSPQS